MTVPVHAIQPDVFPWFDYSRYTFSLGLHADGKAWLSGHSASEYDPDERTIVVRGGIAEQARTAYAKVEAILDGAGLEPHHVVRIVENLTDAGRHEYEDAARVRRELFGERPAVAVTSVDRLLRDAAVLEVEVIAARDASVHQAGDGSAIVETDGVVYLSGVEGDPAVATASRQVGQVLDRLGQRLSDVGLVAADIAHIEVGIPVTASRDEVIAEVSGALGAAALPAMVVRRPSRLRVDGQVVAMTAVASRSTLERVGTASTGAPAAVVSGRNIWLSGATSLTDDELPAGVIEQCELLYEAISRTLGAVGADTGSLLKTIEYVTPDGLAAYRGVAAVRERLLRSPYPASTGAVCGQVDRPGAVLEVAATARR